MFHWTGHFEWSFLIVGHLIKKWCSSGDVRNQGNQGSLTLQYLPQTHISYDEKKMVTAKSLCE